MRRRPAVFVPLIPALVLTACGGDDGPAADAVVIDTVAGVERLSYSETAARALPWTVDTVGVIGEAMGAEEYQFGSLSSDGLAGDGHGHVLAVDRQAARILEYGPDGRHVATYGRRGSGPGELAFPGTVDVGPADTVWVTDMMNRRLTGYPRDGGDPRTVPYADGGTFPSFRVEVVEDGFLQTVGRFGPPAEGEEETGERLIRFDAALQPVDTLWTAPPEPSDVVQLEAGGRSVMLSMGQQFWPDFRWGVLSDGGVVVADTVEYLVRLLDRNGTVRRIIRRDPPARATTDADREAVKRRVLAEADSGRGISFGGGGPDRATQRRLAEERVDKMSFAERIPPIRGLRVDPRDRIWVWVADAADPDDAGRIDLYDRDGRLLGELHGFPLPAAFTGPDRILDVRTDDLGVAQIVVMRVEEGEIGE